MQHPDEGVIHTWLDGELPADEAAALEGHIAECADCAALVAEARGLIAASSRIVSALDIVPGDVIPVATPRNRPWYASTQLRAAAAVVLVAGASLIVMREERVPEMKTAMDQAVSQDSPPAAPEVAAAAESPQFSIDGKSGTARRERALMTPPAENRAQSNSAAPSPMKTRTARSSVSAPKQKTDMRDESVVAAETATSAAVGAARLGNVPERAAVLGKVAGAQAQAAAAPPAADLQQRSLSRNRDSAVRFDNVVVTGVATTSDAVGEALREAKLREVKVDTTGNVVVTTYELLPGIQLTLRETSPQAFLPQRNEADQSKKERSGASKANAAPVTPPAPVIALRSNAKIESITWTNSSTGRVYSLSGPFTREQLAALRKRLPAARQ